MLSMCVPWSNSRRKEKFKKVKEKNQENQRKKRTNQHIFNHEPIRKF